MAAKAQQRCIEAYASLLASSKQRRERAKAKAGLRAIAHKPQSPERRRKKKISLVAPRKMTQ